MIETTGFLQSSPVMKMATIVIACDLKKKKKQEVVNLVRRALQMHKRGYIQLDNMMKRVQHGSNYYKPPTAQAGGYCTIH